MRLETKRLILRPWRESDAQSLFDYAKDPRVGPIAGWAPHASVEYSRQIIREVLLARETYAVVLKSEGDRPVGSIGLLRGRASNLPLLEKEGELGFWIGAPYWGQGLIPEAAHALIRHAFEDLGLEILWCGYFDGNEKSHRVQTKCGFVFHHTVPDVYWAPMDDIRTEHITRLTKNQWQARRAACL